AVNLAAGPVSDRAVIAQDAESHVGECPSVCDHEGLAEIGGLNAGAITHSVAANGRGAVAITIAEFRDAIAPAAVIERGQSPRGSLVGTIIEVAPIAVRGHERA